MIDWDKPIETTCGKPAKLLENDGCIYIVAYKQIIWFANRFDVTGESCVSDVVHRIRNVSEKHVRYVNIYNDGRIAMARYRTKEEADTCAERYSNSVGISRIACVRVEYEEGQFDE